MMEDKNQMAHQDPVDQEDLVETSRENLLKPSSPWIMKRKQNISAAGVLQGPASLS